MTGNEPELMHRSQAAKALGRSVAAIDQLIARGDLLAIGPFVAGPDVLRLQRQLTAAKGGALEAPVRIALSPSEFAEATGLSQSTVYRMLRNGLLPGGRAGARWLIPLAAATRQLGLE